MFKVTVVKGNTRTVPWLTPLRASFSLIHRSERSWLSSRERETESTKSGKTRWTIYKLVYMLNMHFIYYEDTLNGIMHLAEVSQRGHCDMHIVMGLR